MPIDNPIAGVNVSSGQYTGDGAADRAIPHGLGTIPSIVFISSDGNQHCRTLKPDIDHLYRFAQGAFGGSITTNMDATNFYVDLNDGNSSGVVHNWVAIG
jgi:hypothetical protein